MNLDGMIRHKREVELCGKGFTFTELSLRDLAQFSSWVKDQRNKSRQERKKRILEDAKEMELSPEKLLAELEKPITEEDVESEMNTIEGLGQLAYLSLKYAYPDITYEDVMKMLSIQDVGKITFIMGGTDDTSKKKEMVLNPNPQ